MNRFLEIFKIDRALHNRVLALTENKPLSFSGSIRTTSDAGDVVIIYKKAEQHPGRFSTNDSTTFDFGNGKVTLSKSGSIYVFGLGETSSEGEGKLVRSKLYLKIKIDGDIFFESNKSSN